MDRCSGVGMKLVDAAQQHLGKTLVLDDVEAYSQEGVAELLKMIHERLAPGSLVEFEVVNWDWLAERASILRRPDPVLCDMLLGAGKRSVWNDLSISLVLLQAGFIRVWTGRYDGLPPHLLAVKAVKLDPDG